MGRELSLWELPPSTVQGDYANAGLKHINANAAR